MIQNHECKGKILVIDDNSDNVVLAKAILEDVQYTVCTASNGQEGVKVAQTYKPDVILLDIMMPGLDGFEVIASLKQDENLTKIKVIMLTAVIDMEKKKASFNKGVDDYIAKPYDPAELLMRVENQVKVRRSEEVLFFQNLFLEGSVEKKIIELQQCQIEMIQVICSMIECRDPRETSNHSKRIARYVKELAYLYGLNTGYINNLFFAVLMHDIGLFKIPDQILNKRELTIEEAAIMQTHTTIGWKILYSSNVLLLKAAAEIALTHHEKWDGSGYPQGLGGENIPVSGRIVALADVFDALTTERSYKKAWTTEEALRFILENSGKHFDPQLVLLFNASFDNFLKIKAEQGGDNDSE